MSDIKVLFWDGSRLCFCYVDYEGLKRIITPEELICVGPVYTHKMHLEGFRNTMDTTPGVNPNPTQEESALSSELDAIQVPDLPEALVE